MSYILNIETATTNCSVSISEKGKTLHTVELNEGFSHAENLHTFIQNALTNLSLKIEQLNAVAVSSGPGSYTGLRIGLSAAKGICYGLKIPLISINTLKILSVKEWALESDVLLCPMLDARRMEVYTAIYDQQLNEVKTTEAKIISDESILDFSINRSIMFFGDGMPKCKALLSTLPNALFCDDMIPSASNMSKLSYDLFNQNKFEDVAYFEPYYLKDYLIIKKQDLH